ncbi:glutaredoxin family protein [Nocardia alni]|uniref:glutaredoxin family protein n=1 Tax=Nocardia alni TaxID=2815723 RepID=UPI001C239883|nr:glutaredoxin domain-containing protein [Nocardia alni]
MDDSGSELVVYRRPGCPYCARLRRVLKRNGVTYREIDIWDDTQAAAFVRSVADGNETVPTVVLKTAQNTRHWVNPAPRKLIAACTADAPELIGGTRRFRLW